MGRTPDTESRLSQGFIKAAAGLRAFFHLGQHSTKLDQLHQLQATLDLGAFMARDPSGTIRYWSEGCQRMYGWTAVEAVGRTSHDLLKTVFPAPLETIEAVLMRDGEWQGELRHQTRRGDEIVVAARMVVRRSADGQPVAVMESVSDLGPIRRAEAALAQSEARFQAVADVMPGFLFVRNANGKVIYVNAAMTSYTGMLETDLLGAGWLACVHSDDGAFAAADWKSNVGPDGSYKAEYRFIGADGEARWHQVHARPFDEANQSDCHWVGTCTDIHSRKLLENELRDVNDSLEQRITERTSELRTSNQTLERLARHLSRTRDAAEQANKSKTRFLASMSHELRTPLNGILGYARLLRLGGDLNAEQDRQVGAMLGAGQHLLGMINRVLSLSEIEADRVSTKMERVDLVDLAQTCLDMIGVQSQMKGLSATLNVESGVPKYFASDSSRLRQILLNLLGNAVKYTSQGNISLRIGRNAEKTALRLAVEDTGTGVPAEKRHLLFQDFERLHQQTEYVEGTGLGLALSSRLAKLLGGSLQYSPSPSGGSVFSLELPLTEPVIMDKPETVAPAETKSSLQLLVVDDVEMNREIASAFLKAGGHQVMCAESGEKAIELAAQTVFDAILMDVRMPGMDGLEATRRIRSVPGPNQNVPILAATAQAFAEQIDECRQAGMDYHLVKPFTPETLQSALAEAIAIGHAVLDPQGLIDASPDADNALDRDSDLPVFDESIFEKSSKWLAPEQVRDYLLTIASRGRSLSQGLKDLDAIPQASEAHALAGSAAMFGFMRLANAARRYERAGDADSDHRSEAALVLNAEIRDSLERLILITGDADHL